jgi:Delta3-Delta2-enoyl-CoA isomerase
LSADPSSPLVLTSTDGGVTTLTMNNPRRLNGWTLPMMTELKTQLDRAARSDATSAVVLTGTDPYYSAGVNLSSTVSLSHPKTLHSMIVEHNEGLFNAFLDFPKPIVAAVNGPAIGASVTSATLCDALIASEKATFNTPFARLGVPPEGCSSVLFAKILGELSAQRMLGKEGWKPTGAEAAEAGLATSVVPHDQVVSAAQALAAEWVAQGAARTYRGGFTREALKAVNARESVSVADAFLAAPFLEAQYRFLRSKKKRGPAVMFFALWRTRPLWSRML